MYLRYGGDKHFLGSFNNDVAANESFLRWTAAGFGFKNINSSLPRVAGLVTNVTLVAWNGDRSGGGAMQAAVMTVPVDVTHWYRFIAKMDLKNSLYDVVAYDMGAEQPTLATATPTEPVATFSALPFRKACADIGGISCFSVNANYTAGSWPLDETLQPMIDNIRVKHLSGFSLVIR